MSEKGGSAKPIRCLLDVIGGTRDDEGILEVKIPERYFGRGKHRILDKFVLVAIAASANPDGTGAWISRETIACRCLVSVRAVEKSINRLVASGLLIRESRAHHIQGTRIHLNVYTIKFPDLSADSEHHWEPEEHEKEVPDDGDGQHEREVRIDEGVQGEIKVRVDNDQVEQSNGSTRTTESNNANNGTAQRKQLNDQHERDVRPTVLLPPGNRPFLVPPNNTSNTAMSGKRTTQNTDIAAAGPPSPALTQQPATTVEPLTELELMARIDAVGEKHWCALPKNKMHREEAILVAKKYGAEVFLAGLSLWLGRSETVEELRIGSPREDGSIPLKTWVLHEFCNSGSGLRALKRVSRYGSRPAPVLVFLAERDLDPDKLTEDHYRALAWIHENGLWDDFDLHSTLTGDVTDLLARAPEVVGNVPRWSGYEPFAERLRLGSQVPEPVASL